MKTILFALFLLAATAAFGQGGSGAGVLDSQPQILKIPSHDLHASQNRLGDEKTLLFASNNVVAKGERPVWEAMGPSAPEVPLGDVARLYRGQHAVARKAVMTLEKQGQR